MSPVGFEPTISAGEQPQTYTLDRAATGTGILATILTFLSVFISFKNYIVVFFGEFL
jgi:hypothetical protein